jgi:hypothetical protein
VALTEAALQEPGMAAELCAAAGRLRAKLYFLSTDVAKEGTAIQAVAGGIVRFQVRLKRANVFTSTLLRVSPTVCASLCRSN